MIKVEARRRRIEASFFDDLIKVLGKSMFNGMAERVEDGARAMLNWSLKKLALTVIAAGITIAAVVLLLIAGVQGLIQASVAPFLSYLIVGVVGLGIGATLFLVKR